MALCVDNLQTTLNIIKKLIRLSYMYLYKTNKNISLNSHKCFKNKFWQVLQIQQFLIRQLYSATSDSFYIELKWKIT